MTETTEAAERTIIDRYVAVWSEPDAEARRAAIGGLWEPDGVEYVEGIQFRGHEELDDRIAHAYETFVASGKYNVTMADDVSRHDDIITFSVQLSTPEGEVAWARPCLPLARGDGPHPRGLPANGPAVGGVGPGALHCAAGSASDPAALRAGSGLGRAPGYQASRSVSVSRTVLPSI